MKRTAGVMFLIATLMAGSVLSVFPGALALAEAQNEPCSCTMAVCCMEPSAPVSDQQPLTLPPPSTSEGSWLKAFLGAASLLERYVALEKEQAWTAPHTVAQPARASLYTWHCSYLI